MWKVAPLSSGFMLASILGFIISVYSVPRWFPTNGTTWAFTFATLFAIMFVASMISMTYSDVEEKLKI